jgi:large subunit ribosomal protein L13e
MLRPNVKNNFREGRGFSLEELKLVNLTPEKAKRIGIAIDRRRKSALEENVKVLKYILEKGS